MALATGTRLGAYEVVGLLGAGGMGEVYRARDTRLSRDVAIKVLPDAFAQDPERLARFDREARMLASLNHPNIAAIYGVEEADGASALIMELVEGPTLAELIAARTAPEAESLRSRPRDSKAGLRIDDAVTIAKQIADALEAAHETGVIHRRFEAREHQGATGRDRQGPRLRPGQSRSRGCGQLAGGAEPLAHHHEPRWCDRCWRAARDRRLHVA